MGTLASVPSSNWFSPIDNNEQDWLIPYAAVSAAIGVEVGDLCYDYGSGLDVAYPAGQQASGGSESADQATFMPVFVGCSIDKVLSTETNATRRFVVKTQGVKVFDCPSQAWNKGDLIGIYSDGVNSPVSQKVDKVSDAAHAIGVCVKGTLGVSVTTVTAYFIAKNYTGEKTLPTTLGAMTVSSLVSSASTFPINGQTAAQGGSVTVTGGTSSTAANAGGAVALVGGTPGSTGVGGAVTLTAGAGGSASGNGGVASLTGGAGTAGNGAGGAANQTGGAGQGTGAGGAVGMTGGASGAGATGNGGAATITGGAALSTNGTGGAASLIGGVGKGTGAGGAVVITGGASAGGATGAGGAATITGGAAGTTNDNGGAASLIGGAGAGTGAGGAITITSGAAGSTGVAGAVNISVGGATAGNGSAMTLTAGNGAGGTASGGNINLVPGTAVSTGVPGTIQVNSVSGLFDVVYNQGNGTFPASGNSYTIFTANRAYRVVAVSMIESTFGTSETINVQKDTGTGAPGSGSSVLTGAMTPAVSNTRVTGTLTPTVATLTMAAGDRLSIKVAGTVGSAAGLSVSVTLCPC